MRVYVCVQVAKIDTLDMPPVETGWRQRKYYVVLCLYEFVC